MAEILRVHPVTRQFGVVTYDTIEESARSELIQPFDTFQAFAPKSGRFTSNERYGTGCRSPLKTL